MIAIPIDHVAIETKSSKKIEEKSFVKVESSNASTYLDPGTATENCECGCS